MRSVLFRIERGGALSAFATHPAVCFVHKGKSCFSTLLDGPHDNKSVASCPVSPRTRSISNTAPGAKDASGIKIRVEMIDAPTGPKRTASFLSFLARTIDYARQLKNGTNRFDGLSMVLALGDGVHMDTLHQFPHSWRPGSEGSLDSPYLTFDKAAVDTRAVAVPDRYFIDSRG